MQNPISSVDSQAESLWKKAFNTLEKSTRAILNQTATHRRDILAAVLQVAEDRRATSMRKRWKFKRSNGETIIVRDVLEKIVSWVDKFKAVGDVAVQFDPTNASLPWAAFRFLLKVTVNDVQQYGTMIHDLETIARIITRYKEFENLYLSRTSPFQVSLESALVVLYAKVLFHMASIIEYFSESTSRVFKLEDVRHMQDIMSQETEVLKLASLKDAEILHFLETTVLRLQDQSNKNTISIDEKQRINMIRWLSTSPCHLHHSEISDSRMNGFGAWLLAHKEYREWYRLSSSSVLLVHGIPGCGKTHLSSVVVDELLENAVLHPGAAPFAYFYCMDTKAEPERSSTLEILRSVLRQLSITTSKGHVRDILNSEFERRLDAPSTQGLELPRLTSKECVDLLLSVANEDPITIVLDAVDQVEEQHRFDLLDALSRILREAGNVVKVFVTSRNDNELLSTVPLASKIMVTKEDTRNDMEAFIRQNLDDARLLGGKLPTETQTALYHTLLDDAGEMFLWASRQIYHLRHRKIQHAEDLLPALKTTVLSDLNQLYDDCLAQVFAAGETSRKLAVHTFSWLLYMEDLMTPSALKTAISFVGTSPIDVTSIDLSDLCAGLIVIDTDRDCVRFSHQSVQEFLLRSKPDLFSPCISHATLASACIKSVSLGPPNSKALSDQKKDFYFYASVYWASHFSKVDKQKDEAVENMRSFIFEENSVVTSLSFEAWMSSCEEVITLLPIYHPLVPALNAIRNEASSPLFLGSEFGLYDLLEIIASSKTEKDWNRRNDLGHTAIYLAAASGHTASILLLIAEGAEVNIEGGRHGSPLHAACFNGHVQVIEILLQNGASTTYGSKFECALQAAFRGGHEAVTLTLIRQGSSIQSVTDYERVSHMAAEYGFCHVIDELQTTPYALFRVEEKRNKQQLRIAKAIKGGQAGVIRQLLKNVPDPLTILPKDAVAIAALYGHDGLVNFLLDNLMSINEEGTFGTPLRSASLTDRKSTVKLLICRGADFKSDQQRGNALYVAATKGHCSIARTLIQNGMDVNQITGSLGTALQAAALHGHTSIVKALVDAGANLYQRGYFNDAFCAAAERGHHSIINFFLANGYSAGDDFPSQTLKRTRSARPSRPINYSIGDLVHAAAVAATVAHENTLQSPPISSDLLVPSQSREDSSINGAEDSDSITDVSSFYFKGKRVRHGGLFCHPLETAAASGRIETVRTLLFQKKTLHIHDQTLRMAAIVAAAKNHHEILKILMDSFSQEEEILQCIQSMLHKIGTYRAEIVDYVLSKATEKGCTPEEHCSVRPATPIIRYIHEDAVFGGYHENIYTTNRSKILDCCKSGDQRQLATLVSANENISITPTDLFAGLSIAHERCHETVCNLLLHYYDRSLGDLVKDASRNIDTFQLLLLLRPTLAESPMVIRLAATIGCTDGNSNLIEYLLDYMGLDADARIPEPPYQLDDSWRISELDHSYHRKKQLDQVPSELSSPHHPQTQKPEDTQRKTKPKLCETKPSQEPHFISLLQLVLEGFYCRDAPSIKKHRMESKFPGLERVLSLLLNNGANPNSTGGRDAFPIQIATRFCPGSVVGQLIESGAVVTNVQKGPSAIVSAIVRDINPVSTTKKLLDAGATFPEDLKELDSLLENVLSHFGRDEESLDWVKYSRYRDQEKPRDSMQHSLPTHVFSDGPVEMLELLLRNHAEAEVNDKRYILVFQWACFCGKTGLIEFLISRGVDANVSWPCYGNALQAAAENGHIEAVKLLLSSKVDLNILGGRYGTALRAAIVNGHLDVVQLLINHGADASIKSSNEEELLRTTDSQSPNTIKLAVQSNNKEIVKFLLESELASVEDDMSDLPHPLIMSCQKGNQEITETLLKTQATPNIVGRMFSDYKYRYQYGGFIAVKDSSPLHAAISSSDTELVETLLSRGADPNILVEQSYCPTPLSAAIKNLSGGTDPDIFDAQSLCPMPLVAAPTSSKFRIVQALVKAGASIVGPSPHPNFLREACAHGNLDVIEIFLETLCRNVQDAAVFIDEAIMAVTQKHILYERILMLLLQYVPLTSKRLVYVCKHGSKNTVAYMLGQGLDVNEAEADGMTPLLSATQNLNAEAVHVLVEAGAHVGPQGRGRLQTPLCSALSTLARADRKSRRMFWKTDPSFAAKIYQCKRIIKTLLANGASIQSEGDDEEDPHHLASVIGDENILELLAQRRKDEEEIS